MELISFLPLAFFGGLLSFLSPCVLPLVPAYLSFAAGLQFKEMTQPETKTKQLPPLLLPSLAFVAGFSCVFILLGAGAAAINPLLLAYQEIFAQIAGVIIIIFGLMVADILPLAKFVPALAKTFRFDTPINNNNRKLSSAFIIGLAFAFGWTPCIGPILAAILTLAATRDSLGEGVILLAVYSAGLGVPFILAALGIGRALRTTQILRRYMRAITLATGLLLIATGFLILSGRLQSLGIYLLEYFPILAKLG